MTAKHDAWSGPFGAVPDELPSDKSTLTTILSHVSVRQFRDEALSNEHLAVVLEAMRRAPTSSAMQSTLYVCVTDKAALQQLRPHVGGQQFIQQCGAFIVGCMDLRHIDRVTSERGYPNRSSDFRLFITSLEDISISTQNASLAAESLGLGTVMVGGTVNGAAEVAELLGLPHRVIPLLGLAIGWPDQPPEPVRPRLPRPMVFHHNRYDATAEAEFLNEHDREILERGYYDGRRIDWSDIGMPGEDPVPDGLYGWQEHAARKQARTWWLASSPKLCRDLRKLGWNPLDLLKFWEDND